MPSMELWKGLERMCMSVLVPGPSGWVIMADQLHPHFQLLLPHPPSFLHPSVSTQRSRYPEWPSPHIGSRSYEACHLYWNSREPDTEGWLPMSPVREKRRCEEEVDSERERKEEERAYYRRLKIKVNYGFCSQSNSLPFPCITGYIGVRA